MEIYLLQQWRTTTHGNQPIKFLSAQCHKNIISPLGSLDTTLGGSSSRYSLSSVWQGEHIKASAYAINYDLTLFSNFSYFLNDPINGDQFNQQDSRNIYGGELSYQFDSLTAGLNMQHSAGLECSP
ncbi:hypothetical protein ACOBV8_17260 [Pseudoalteromonas espejiana]